MLVVTGKLRIKFGFKYHDFQNILVQEKFHFCNWNILAIESWIVLESHFIEYASWLITRQQLHHIPFLVYLLYFLYDHLIIKIKKNQVSFLEHVCVTNIVHYLSFFLIFPSTNFQSDLLPWTFTTHRMSLTLELGFQSYALICLETNIDNVRISNRFFFQQTSDCWSLYFWYSKSSGIRMPGQRVN